ncbi:hypothetical protein E2C01_059659 [Portunus trituberculatus]|uniref:BESS domain-containing protein n=1 Tax=Portunus trituberculatus TaxID=210409 RepID=A0A5B7H5Z1_PORTR|nr:hypothetical protein [Portunus trituberculatus]
MADPDPDESAILDDEDDSLMSTSSIDPPESRRKGVFKKPSQPSKITPFQASLISSLDQATKTLQSPKNDPEDADKSYLMSLLPDYKNLSTAKKWEFRTYVANFFQNVYLTSPPTTSQQFYSQNYYQPQWRGGDQQQFWSNTNTSYSASSSPTGSVASPCIPSPNPQ